MFVKCVSESSFCFLNVLLVTASALHHVNEVSSVTSYEVKGDRTRQKSVTLKTVSNQGRR